MNEKSVTSSNIFGLTSSILVMLLAPKILWTQANLCGLVGGKYGASTQSLGHLLLKDLQAAHLLEWDMVGFFRICSKIFCQIFKKISNLVYDSKEDLVSIIYINGDICFLIADFIEICLGFFIHGKPPTASFFLIFLSKIRKLSLWRFIFLLYQRKKKKKKCY